jgi:hypothetical protein
VEGGEASSASGLALASMGGGIVPKRSLPASAAPLSSPEQLAVTAASARTSVDAGASTPKQVKRLRMEAPAARAVDPELTTAAASVLSGNE